MAPYESPTVTELGSLDELTLAQTGKMGSSCDVMGTHHDDEGKTDKCSITSTS